MTEQVKENFKAGDWVIFDMKIGQIKELMDGGIAEFSDGFFCTSGKLIDRFRPLTLNNKVVAETMDHYYNQLRQIDGEAGFNYPDISWHFSQLVLAAIDGDPDVPYTLAKNFVSDAREYKPVIQGVSLFRRSIRRTATGL